MTFSPESALLLPCSNYLETTADVTREESSEGMGAVIWMCLACVMVALLTLGAIIVWGA